MAIRKPSPYDLKPYCDPLPNSRDSSLNKLGSTIYLVKQHAYNEIEDYTSNGSEKDFQMA